MEVGDRRMEMIDRGVCDSGVCDRGVKIGMEALDNDG